MSLQAIQRSSLANVSQIPLQAAAIATAVKAPIAGRAIGAGAVAVGISNFMQGDKAAFSRVGSAAQVVGGLTMMASANPVLLTRGATAVIAGSLLNVIDRHLDQNHHAAAVGLKGAVIAAAAGAIAVGRGPLSIGGLVTAGVVVGAFSWLGAQAKAESGHSQMSPGMARVAIGLRSRH